MRTEAERMMAENARRDLEVDERRYSVTDPAELFLRFERQRAAIALLSSRSRFPGPESRCLELGCGSGGWLSEISGWGVSGRRLFGTDLDPSRLFRSVRRFPAANHVVADGATLPWMEESFELIVLSTVLSSVLDPEHRSAVCREAVRVLAPQGAIVVSDFGIGNPSNRAVVGIHRSALSALFPGAQILSRRVGLAPPLLRVVAPFSWWAAQTLSLLPWLRTHWVAVITRGVA